MDLEQLTQLSDRIKAEVGKSIVGQDENIQMLLVALLCQGHILLEGAPGTAKTFMVQSLAASLSLDFGRVQFTPDLMPGDILGTNLFDFQSSEFVLTKGPIFTQILLADEINRSPPKTQAALLEAMNERSVTIDGDEHKLGDGFMVVATQNPIEHQGTYPLPEAQLDRFLFKLIVDYPSADEEREIIKRHGSRTTLPKLTEMGLDPIAHLEDLRKARALTSSVILSDEIVDYIVELVRASRRHHLLAVGASPRAGNMLAAASRALAALKSRDYVVPDDVKALIAPALRHRIFITPEAELDRVDADEVVSDILKQVEAPK